MVIDQFEKELKLLKSPKNIAAIEQSVNNYMSDIMKKLRAECVFLNEDEKQLLLLNYAGFEPVAICIFLDMQKKNFYTKRARIKKKILHQNPPHAELFISKAN